MVVLFLREDGTPRHESGLRKFGDAALPGESVAAERKFRFLLMELLRATRRKSRPSTAVE